MTQPCRSPLALSLAAVAVMAIANCGGSSSSPTTTPTPTPTPAPADIVVSQGSFSGLGSLVLANVTPFTTTATGTLEATVDWTFDTNDIDIYLTAGDNPCTLDQFNSGQCSFVASSESATAKPEVITAANAAAGTYTLYIGNRGSTEESVSYQVVLTTTQVTSSSPASQSRRAEPLGKETYVSVQPGQ